MPDRLEAELDLDYGQALAGADQLADAIESALQAGAAAGADAVASALSGIDPGDVEVPVSADTTAAEAALTGLEAEPVDVPVDADVSAAQGALDTLEGEPIEIPVGADTTGAETEIDSITGQEVTVPVDADTSAAQAEIAGIEGDAITVQVDAETGNAAAEVDDVTESLTGAGGAAQQSAGALGGVSTAFSGLGAVSGAAQGELGGVTGALRSVGPGGAVAGAGILAVGASLGTLFAAGSRGVAATERLNLVFGDLSSSAQKINIGGLNGDLGELAIKSGNSGAALKQSVANLAQFAISSGQSKEAARGFTEQVSALALRATAMNPQLGEAGEVSDRLGLALARGGRAAARFSIDLTPAEINARALANTGKTVATELTNVEKAMAGAQLATEKLGGKLGTDFQQGTQQAAVQLKALKAEITSALGQAGAPLVAPLIEALRSLIPAITSVSAALGTLGGAAVVPISQLAGVIGGLPGPLLAVAAAAGIAALALNKMGEGSIIGGVNNALNSFRQFAPVIGVAGLAIGAMGVATDNTAEAVTGFATAGAAAGIIIAGPLGAAVGAATGAAVGYGLAWAHSQSQLDSVKDSTQQLSSAISSQQTPAIEAAVGAVKRSTEAFGLQVQANRQVADSQADFSRGMSESAAQVHALGSGVQQYNVTTAQGRIFQDEFTKALAKSPEAAGVALSVFDKLGVSTQTMHLQLNSTVAALEATKTASAAVAVAASPLKATFEQSATALGTEQTQLFNSINALGNREEASINAAKANQAFTEAVASGNAEQVRASAQASAAAESQKVFTSAIAEGKTAQEAGTAGLAAFRQQLEALAATTPAGPLRDAIQGLIADLDHLTSQPHVAKVDLDSSTALVKATALKVEVDRLVQGKPVELAVLTRGFPEAEGQLERLKGRGDLLKDPVAMTAILQDLASGDIAKLTADLDGLGLKTATPKVDADTNPAGARLQEIQGKLDALQGTGATVQIRADNGQAIATVNNTKTTVDATTGTMQISGNPALAQQATTGAVVYANTSTGVITIGGNAAPANSVTVGTVGSINASSGTVTINGNAGPAHAATSGAVQFANSSTGTIIVNANTGPARSAIQALSGIAITVSVGAVSGLAGAVAAAQASGGTIKGLASGGQTYVGQPVWVGEEGPELMVPQTAGYVLPRAESIRVARAMQRGESGAGGTAIQIAIDARGATRESVRDLKRVDWRNITTQIETRAHDRAFLGGRR